MASVAKLSLLEVRERRVDGVDMEDEDDNTDKEEKEEEEDSGDEDVNVRVSTIFNFLEVSSSCMEDGDLDVILIGSSLLIELFSVSCGALL